MIVNLQATPLDAQTYVLECSECGPLGPLKSEDTHDAALEHLSGWHGSTHIDWQG